MKRSVRPLKRRKSSIRSLLYYISFCAKMQSLLHESLHFPLEFAIIKKPLRCRSFPGVARALRQAPEFYKGYVGLSMMCYTNKLKNFAIFNESLNIISRSLPMKWTHRKFIVFIVMHL